LELQDSEILGTLPKTCPRIFRDNKTEVKNASEREIFGVQKAAPILMLRIASLFNWVTQPLHF
jgi:hypothetical protein